MDIVSKLQTGEWVWQIHPFIDCNDTIKSKANVLMIQNMGNVAVRIDHNWTIMPGGSTFVGSQNDHGQGINELKVIFLDTIYPLLPSGVTETREIIRRLEYAEIHSAGVNKGHQHIISSVKERA